VNGHFNGLSPKEAELLALLSEECGEVIQAIAKIQRHGFYSEHPDRSTSNREDLEKEVGHIQHAVERMIGAGILNVHDLAMHKSDKADSISQWLHHA
jgi:hypothetical protein